MSGMKRLMDQQDEQLAIATKIAIRAGVLVLCEFHGSVSDNLIGDIAPAYKLGNYLLSNGELGDTFSSSRELTDTIKQVVEDSGMECYDCARFAAE